MKEWRDQAIVLNVRPHGEGGGVLSVLTREQGRHAGYIHGIHASSRRALLEPGTFLDVEWKSRTDDALGVFSLQERQNFFAHFLDEPLKMAAVISACALCHEALPERERCAGIYNGLEVLIDLLSGEDDKIWPAAYVMWELALLKELGFGLELSRCTVTGRTEDLCYVSPKTGRAVCLQEALPYKDKLLPLPQDWNEDGAALQGLALSGYFLENRVFAHHRAGIPPARLRFQERFAKTIGQEGAGKAHNRETEKEVNNVRERRA